MTSIPASRQCAERLPRTLADRCVRKRRDPALVYEGEHVVKRPVIHLGERMRVRVDQFERKFFSADVFARIAHTIEDVQSIVDINGNSHDRSPS